MSKTVPKNSTPKTNGKVNGPTKWKPARIELGLRAVRANVSPCNAKSFCRVFSSNISFITLAQMHC
ncbi:hypothetical protein [Pedosphaera parvula]|uniref:Uncharacterized protein n=1 Tax=Pedosphaera parvula (strain Ellin514) TaxID=320771 RepID=B9XLR3_PEDPL|nr:hypothetical protein [Pedosphaera parvula]EEF59170.1 hypothetical protein Cflav_PD2375 [Pedosphaera parvula Ellin514]